MNIQTYVATGQVIDRETTQGMPDLQVEAWDSNTRNPQQLGATKTDENGRFRISFDLKKFGYETPPDLFFKIMLSHGTFHLIADRAGKRQAAV